MIGYVSRWAPTISRERRDFTMRCWLKLGATRALEEENFVTWICGDGTPMLGVIKPFDEAGSHGGKWCDDCPGCGKP